MEEFDGYYLREIYEAPGGDRCPSRGSSKFLDQYYKNSKFICSGPQDPRVGGVIVANVESVDEARQIMKSDPFYINGAAEYQFIEFLPLKWMSVSHALSNERHSRSCVSNFACIKLHTLRTFASCRR